MLFATLDYLVFLPLVAAAHWALRSPDLRAAFIAVTSLVFYATWSPADAALLLAIIALAYAAGVVRASNWLVVPALLLPMCLFKVAGGHLPIGISFYTFQAVAYLIDVRRGMAPERNPVRFATFLLFFPHLVAGPILRAGQLLPQIAADRSLTRADVGYAIVRIVTGLVKKILVADVLRVGIVDTVFGDPGSFHTLETIVALYAYSLQIYCDFSGYTDIAIGSAKLLGFTIPENFDRPYLATSVANYWRRWHITLSDWVRDYVYYPLGGSRSHPYRNTFVTLLILALWHDVSLTFVLYGLVHGAAVSVNRWWRKSGYAPERPSAAGLLVRWAATLQLVVFARILFRARDLETAGGIVASLGDWVPAFPRFSDHALVVLGIGWAVHLSPPSWSDELRSRFSALPWPAQGAALAAVGWLCAAWRSGDTLAFVYDRF